MSGNNKDILGGPSNLIVNESGTAAQIENYKIVILGDQFVGKTSLLYNYKYETAEESYAVISNHTAHSRNRLHYKECFSRR